MTNDVPEIGHVHPHPDVNGGWLRPAVFGAMDGLVSNLALMMGVHGGSTDPSAVTVAGFAGLAAGALSMAAGEYTSVASQAEFAAAQVEIERHELHVNSEGEQAELVEMLEGLGLEPPVAATAAAQIHRDPEAALRFHTLHEMGVDPDDYASPTVAAVSSFVSFAVGAFIPLVPWLFGFHSGWPTVGLALLALFGCGALVTNVTKQNWLVGGTRQLVLGGVAAAVTYGIGEIVGSRVG